MQPAAQFPGPNDFSVENEDLWEDFRMILDGTS